MSGNAQALGHTTITNNASVSGNAILDGYITVGRNANISGDAKIYIAADIHKACDLARAHINLPSGLDNSVNRKQKKNEKT